MECKHCHCDLNGEEKFCPSCGAELEQSERSEKEMPLEKHGNSKKKWVIISGVIVTTALCVGVGIVQYNKQSAEKKAQQEAIQKKKEKEAKIIDDKEIEEKVKVETEEKETNEVEEETKNEEEFIFPHSDIEALTDSQVESLSHEQLAFARNEIIARHGRIFEEEPYKSYFERKSWYSGSVEPEEFDSNYETELSETEKANIELIKKYEKTEEESIEEVAKKHYGDFLEYYRQQELEGFKQQNLEHINPLFYIYNDTQLYYTVLDLANDGVPELFISDKETIYGAFSLAGDGQIMHLVSPPGASLMGERTVYDICENNMIREISSGGATNYTISYLGVYPHATAAKYEEIICRDGERYYWGEDRLPEGEVSYLSEATAKDCSEMENKYPLKQDIIWLKLSEFELQENLSENQETTNIGTPEEALAYLKQYLTDNGQYIPSHIAMGDFGEPCEYGEYGYKFRGYDDMETHIATSFIYCVSSDGKIYDTVMQQYIN